MSGTYDDYAESAQGGGAHGFMDFNTDTIHCGIVSGADYTENLTLDQDWDDLGIYTLAACYNSEPTQLMTPTIGVVAARTVDSDDQTFAGVAIDGAKVVDAVVVFKSTGVITTDQLALFYDGFTPVTPNGGDIVIQWNGSGLFAF